MGYTHYWERKPVFPKNRFKKVVEDIRRLMPLFSRLGIKLAGGDGEGLPEITDECICFNGLEKCGHSERNLGIAWPADDAKGVCFSYQKGEAVHKQTTLLTAISSAGWSVGETAPLALGDSDVAGEWYAGCKLQTRTCGGDCSHDTFDLPREIEKEEIEFKERVRGKNPGKYYFEFCKTAYKPYDLAVICALIIARHHLGSKYIMVRSNGNRDQWADGRQLCQLALGYGEDFHFEHKPDPKPYWEVVKRHPLDEKTWEIRDYPGFYGGTIGLTREYRYWGHRGSLVYEARTNTGTRQIFPRFEQAKAFVENELRKRREIEQTQYSQYNKDL